MPGLAWRKRQVELGAKLVLRGVLGVVHVDLPAGAGGRAGPPTVLEATARESVECRAPERRRAHAAGPAASPSAARSQA